MSFFGNNVIIAGPKSVVSLTWDASGTIPLTDGSGSWNATGGTNWAYGGSPPVLGAWKSGAIAVFGVQGGIAGTITVGTVSANGITFNAAFSGNYTLSGGTLTLTGTNPTIKTNVNGTIGSVIAGTAGLIKNGSGTLTLSGANTYTGPTTLNNGTILVVQDSNLGNGGALVVNNSSTLQIGDLVSNNPLVLTLNRALTLNDNSSLNFTGTAGDKTIAGIVSGPTTSAISWKNITSSSKNDSKNLILSNTGNTFNGTLNIAVSGSSPTDWGLYAANIGDSASPIVLGDGSDAGCLYWTGAAKTFSNRQFVLNGGTSAGGRIANNGTGPLTITKDLLVTAAGQKNLRLRGSNGDRNIFAGSISDGTNAVIGLVKEGNGFWVLSGTNTYTGATSITDGGTLAVTKFVSAPTKVLQVNFTSSAMAVFFTGSGPVAGETYKVFTGPTTNTYSSGNILLSFNGSAVPGRSATYDSTTSTVTIV